MRTRICLAALAVLLSGHVAPAALHVELSVNPTQTLPGLDVYLKAHVVNDGPQVTLARVVHLRFTPAGGEPFIAVWADNRKAISLDIVDDRDLTVGTSEAVDLFVVPDFMRRSWALDRRVAVPGSYSVEMVLFDADDTHAPLAVSTKASLEVRAPAQHDAEILDALSSGKGGPELFESVLRDSPQSPYLPYLSEWLLRDTNEKRIAGFRQVISFHPDSPMTPRLELWVAKLYETESFASFSENHDVDLAAQIAGNERTILERLANGNNEWARRKAQHWLDDGIPTRAAFIELKKRYY